MATGKALVSLDSGSRVLDKFWVITQQTERSFLPQRNGPNIYTHVLLMSRTITYTVAMIDERLLDLTQL